MADGTDVWGPRRTIVGAFSSESDDDEIFHLVKPLTPAPDVAMGDDAGWASMHHLDPELEPNAHMQGGVTHQLGVRGELDINMAEQTSAWSNNQPQPFNPANTFAPEISMGVQTSVWNEGQPQPSNSATTVAPDRNTADEDWASQGGRRRKPQQANPGKRLAVSNPAREQAESQRLWLADAMEKATAARREKRMLEMELAQNRAELEQMKQSYTAEMQARDQAWNQLQNDMRLKWDAATEERNRDFRQNLSAMREETYARVLQDVEARNAQSREDYEAQLKAANDAHKREEERLQTEHDTNMAALHTRLSRQSGGAQGRQENGMDDVRFPDAPPEQMPQFVSAATKKQRKVEAIVRGERGRVPDLVMTEPAQPEPAATPEAESSTSQAGLSRAEMEAILEEKVTEMMQRVKGKRRKPRKAKAGAIVTLNKAREEQQAEMPVGADLKWKKASRETWRISNGINRTQDWCDYRSLDNDTHRLSELGVQQPNFAQPRFYFGYGWADSVWNSQLLDHLVQHTLKKREEDPYKYGVPDVSEGYLKALFHNFLKDAQAEWQRNQPRPGETVAVARQRAVAFNQQRRNRNNLTSRKTNKYDLRVNTADMMMRLALAAGNYATAASWRWIRDELLKELGAEGMSSEEDGCTDMLVGDKFVKTTVHNIKIMPWRTPEALEPLEMIDKEAEKRTSSGNKRPRIRTGEISTSPAPLRLPRGLIHADWLSDQKEFIPDIENELEISEKEFKMMAFAAE
ncbi:hypothetical protein B0H15DRAFT_957953 [Mycena belliarum]|uniref:Uncharacterized protein n=1 Tax=Mycena belliarum TaxID=1033014 RepID=A0AAD6TLV4_9AGAR|nr:hypothetical protein B0H15DRAFT_957953 [Mycena belliae]